MIVPLFALANAGIQISGDFLRTSFTSPVTLGILVGYVAGKPLGILGASWLASRGRLGGPRLPVATTCASSFATCPSDVHEHAQLAGEAAEAAGAQGAFWQMHDLLLAHQDALRPSHLAGYAEQLGLDVGRFGDRNKAESRR